VSWGVLDKAMCARFAREGYLPEADYVG